MPNNQTEYSREDELACAMQQTGSAWREALNKALAPLKLTQLQWVVVDSVARLPGSSQSEIAALIGVEHPSVVRLLDGLEATGWVQRRACLTDRRTNRVHLNPTVGLRLTEAYAVVREVHERAIKGLSPADRTRLVTMLGVMVEGLQAAAPEMQGN